MGDFALVVTTSSCLQACGAPPNGRATVVAHNTHCRLKSRGHLKINEGPDSRGRTQPTSENASSDFPTRTRPFQRPPLPTKSPSDLAVAHHHTHNQTLWVTTGTERLGNKWVAPGDAATNLGERTSTTRSV